MLFGHQKNKHKYVYSNFFRASKTTFRSTLKSSEWKECFVIKALPEIATCSSQSREGVIKKLLMAIYGLILCVAKWSNFVINKFILVTFPF
jgi:hypothetical protein